MTKASSSLLLPDVNVLISVAWPNHQFHVAATRRLESGAARWATCALTQLGFIRLSSNPSAVPGAKSPAEAASLLASMVRDPLHIYLESLPPPVELQRGFEKIVGYKQVTDAYLLSIARRYGATFVTFDARLKILIDWETAVEILGL
jgi:hypothetical protein